MTMVQQLRANDRLLHDCRLTARPIINLASQDEAEYEGPTGTVEGNKGEQRKRDHSLTHSLTHSCPRDVKTE